MHLSRPRRSARRRSAFTATLGLAAVLALTAATAACTGREPSGESHDDESEGGVTDTADAYADRQLERMSLEEKVGQLFMVYAYGSSADTDHPDHVAANRDLHGVDTPARLVEQYHLGGVIYFTWADNVTDPRQTAELSNGLQRVALGGGDGVPLLIAIDQEYGVIARIGEPVTQFPGAMALGATRDPKAAADAGAAAGAELRAIGVNQNFAPVADVNVDPANPVIGVRSFGSDPSLVAELTAAQVRGYQSDGVAAAAKHFPGHGDTDVDSHLGLPVITHSVDEWRELDAPPFEAAIEAGVDMIMTAHLQFPALDDSLLPATLSEPILTGVLRDELGFEGVIVTDSLEMEGVRTEYGDERVPVMALLAGADLLLMPPDLDLAYNAVLDAVADGELTEERIDESVRRLLVLKHARGIVDEPVVDVDAVDGVVGAEAHRATAADIADRSITLAHNDGMLPLAADDVGRALVVGWGESTTAALGAAVEEHGAAVEVVATGDDPDADAIDDAVAATAGKDVVLVSVNGVAGSGQRALVESLVDTGVPVVVLSVGGPYDLAYATEAGASLAAYSYNSYALASLAAVAFGDIDPQGTLPVDVPAAGGADKPLYAFGHGLNY